MSKLRCALTGCVLALSATVLAPVGSTSPAVAVSTGCAPQDRTRVVQSGTPTYAATGAAAGKYNASSSQATLHYTLSMTTARSTSWTGTAKVSVSWGIAQVEGSTSYNVTKTTTTGESVTDDLPVPGHSYGYDQPKVEYRTFHIYAQELLPACTWTTTVDYGYLRAITAVPFFSSCVATSACTPKP